MPDLDDFTDAEPAEGDEAGEPSSSKRPKLSNDIRDSPSPSSSQSRDERPSSSSSTKVRTDSTIHHTPTGRGINPGLGHSSNSVERGNRTPNSAARNLSNQLDDSSLTTSEATGITDTGAPMQIDTPAGPDHNTKGTLQGEAGNRKLQKPRVRYGIVEVR